MREICTLRSTWRGMETSSHLRSQAPFLDPTRHAHDKIIAFHKPLPSDGDEKSLRERPLRIDPLL